MKSTPLARRVITPAWRGRPLLDQTWQDHASCRDRDYAIFFPSSGNSKAVKAREACAACPVRAACREYAIGRDERSGIWGGLGPAQLGKIRVARDRAVQAAKRAARDLASTRVQQAPSKPSAGHQGNTHTPTRTLDSPTPRRRTTP